MFMRFGNYGYNDGGYYAGPEHIITMVLIWILIIVIIGLLIRRSRMGFGPWRMRHHGWMGMENNALEILKERYAKGEINKTEYEEKKKDLM